jgi:hypothetical protein
MKQRRTNSQRHMSQIALTRRVIVPSARASKRHGVSPGRAGFIRQQRHHAKRRREWPIRITSRIDRADQGGQALPPRLRQANQGRPELLLQGDAGAVACQGETALD